MLIIAALVTESPQPVREPIRMQNRVCTINALFLFNLKALSTIGRQTRKPEKCVPDTASRCEQHDILKSRRTDSPIRDLSPVQTAAASALEEPSNADATAFKASSLSSKKKFCINPVIPAPKELFETSKLSQVITYKMPCFLRYPR